MRVTDDLLNKIRLICREQDIPFFNDETLQFIVESSPTENWAIYRCLIMKSEDTTLSLSGLSVADSSNYFKRLARMYKPNNGGVL